MTCNIYEHGKPRQASNRVAPRKHPSHVKWCSFCRANHFQLRPTCGVCCVLILLFLICRLSTNQNPYTSGYGFSGWPLRLSLLHGLSLYGVTDHFLLHRAISFIITDTPYAAIVCTYFLVTELWEKRWIPLVTPSADLNTDMAPY